MTMKKKNFRTLTSVPVASPLHDACITIKCVACDISITLAGDIDTKRKELKRRHWHIINENEELFCCPNCDVTILEKINI